MGWLLLMVFLLVGAYCAHSFDRWLCMREAGRQHERWESHEAEHNKRELIDFEHRERVEQLEAYVRSRMGAYNSRACVLNESGRGGDDPSQALIQL